MNRRNAVIVGALVIAATFGWLIYGGLNSNVVYFLTPAELLARGYEAHNVPIRLGGQVKAGTVNWNASTLELAFVVTDGSADVPVQSKGAPPQMFRDGMGVVIEGRLRGDGVMQSSNLMVMHSNEYYPPDSGQKPQEMYKTLIKAGGP